MELPPPSLNLDYQRLFEAAPGLYLVLAPDLRILAASDAFLIAAGRRREDLIDRPLFDSLPELASTALRRSLERVLASRAPDVMPIEKRPAPAGTVMLADRYWSVINSPVSGPDGTVQYIVQRTEDVTDYTRTIELARNHAVAAEDRLDEIEQIYRDTPVGLFSFDRDFRFLRVNAAMAEINGIPPEMHIGRTMHEVIPALAPIIEQLARPVLDQGLALLNREVRGRTPRAPERQRTWIVNYFPRRSRDGRIEGMFGAVVEITERKIVEEALRQSEERFAKAFQHASIGMALVDLKGRWLKVNRAVCALVGYSQAELLSKTFQDITHPDDLDADLENMRRLLAGEIQSYEMEKRYLHKEGHVVWILLSGALLRDAGNLPLMFIAQIQDITKRKQAEEALARSEHFLKALTNNLPSMVAYWDGDLRCRFANAAYEDWFGRTPEQMQGISLRELLGDDLYQQNGAYVDGALRGEIQRFGQELVRADGAHRYTWAQYIPMIEQGMVRGFYGLVTDVTELKTAQLRLEQMTDALRRRSEEAEAATRAKSAFLSSMSHEIRTPLNAIIGMTGILQDSALDPDQRESADIIRTSGEHLLSLINDILDYSKIEAGKLELEVEPLDVRALLESASDLVTVSADRKRIRMNVAVDPATPTAIAGDASRLRQVLLNLLSNAVKFTPEGGHIELSAGPREKASEPLLEISVSDSGIGISPEAQARLFQPFTQASSEIARKYGGTGLGLSISQRLVGLMRGALSVRSTLGVGSTFTMSIPMVPAKLPPAKETDWQSTLPHDMAERLPLRILVAEDNPVNQKVVGLQLKRLGYQTDFAGNGREALEAVARQPYDVILMDWQMPIMDGLTATREILAKIEPAMRPYIIGMSANVMEDERRTALSSGMRDYLTKPVQTRALADTLMQAFHFRSGETTRGQKSLSRLR